MRRWPCVYPVKEARPQNRVGRGTRAREAWEPPDRPLLGPPPLEAGPPSDRLPKVPTLDRGSEAPLFPSQRTCLTQKKCSPRTSPSGTPTISWTKSKALSQRTHRVTSWGWQGPGRAAKRAKPLVPEKEHPATQEGWEALQVMVTTSVWCCLFTAPTSSVLQMVCTARAPLSSGWPPAWSS